MDCLSLHFVLRGFTAFLFRSVNHSRLACFSFLVVVRFLGGSENRDVNWVMTSDVFDSVLEDHYWSEFAVFFEVDKQ